MPKFLHYVLFLFVIQNSFGFTQDELQQLISDKGDQKLLEVIQLERDEYCLIYSENNFAGPVLKFQMLRQTTSSYDLGMGGQLTPKIFSKQENVSMTVVNSQLIFISWIDHRRDPEGDVYGQLIDRNGIIWNNEGIPIADVNGKQAEISSDSDEQGNIFITWRDYRTDADGNIFSQKLNLFGETLWKKDGLPVIQLSGAQYKPKAVSDRNGGVFIGWVDKSNSSGQLYIQKIDKSGTKSFGEFGKFVSDPSLKTEDYRLFFNRNSGLTIFYTSISSTKKMFVQKLQSNGRRELSAFGSELLSSYDNFEISELIQFGDKFLLLFTVENDGSKIIKAQFLSTKGFFNSSISQVLSNNCSDILNPMVSKFQNDFLIYWSCSSKAGKKVELYGQIISENLQLQLKENGAMFSDLDFKSSDKIILVWNSDMRITAFSDKLHNSERDIVTFAVTRPFEGNFSIEDFDVSFYDGLAKIRWISLHEKNGVSMVLERKTSFENWEVIYSIDVKEKSEKKIRYFDDHLIHHGNYEYRLKFIDPEKNVKYTPIKILSVNVDDEGFFLFQNSPNPFNSSTKITYKLLQSEKVKITIFNSRAEELFVLLNEVQESGTHEIAFNPLSDLPSGVYFYKIQAGKFFDVKKMIYTK